MGDGVANAPHRTASTDRRRRRTHPPSAGMISRPVEAKGGRRRRPSRRTRRSAWPRSGKTQASRGPRPRHAQEVVDPDRESGRWMWMRRPPSAARSCTSSSWGGTTPSPLPVASSFLVHEIRDTIVVIAVFLSPPPIPHAHPHSSEDWSCHGKRVCAWTFTS